MKVENSQQKKKNIGREYIMHRIHLQLIERYKEKLVFYFLLSFQKKIERKEIRGRVKFVYCGLFNY
jgi:prolipoprotein diacylglyceryltransferase